MMKTLPMTSGVLMRPSGSVPSYLSALGGPSFRRRLRAVKALGALGPRAAVAIDAIVEQLVDEGLRIHAIAALGHIGSPARSVVDELSAYLDDDDEEVREATAIAVGRITDERVEACIRLAAILATGDSNTARMRAACHLGELGAVSAVPTLVGALSDPHAGVRQQAAYALGRLGPAAYDGLSALRRALSEPDDDGVRFNAAVAIGRIDGDAELGVPVILEVLAPGGALRARQDESVILVEKHPAQRIMAAEALRDLGYRARSAVDSLVMFQDDSNVGVRRAVCEALDEIRQQIG